MTIEQQVSELVTASNQLTSAVEGKIQEIDTQIGQKKTQVDQFLQDANPEGRYEQEITIGGSKDFFYPVWWRTPDLSFGVSNISILRHYSWNGEAENRPLNPASQHQAALLLEMEGNASGWNGDANFLEIKRFYERYNSTVSHPSFLMYTKAEKANLAKPIYLSVAENTLAANCYSFSGVYLRGGGLTYKIVKNWAGNVNFHDGSDQLRRNIHNAEGIDWSIQWYAEPIAFADKLQPTVNVTASGEPV